MARTKKTPDVAKLVETLAAKKSTVSDFAIIDIKAGRGVVAEHFDLLPDRVGPTPEEFRVPFVLQGYLTGIHSGNDGESQEFSAHVDKIEFIKA